MVSKWLDAISQGGQFVRLRPPQVTYLISLRVMQLWQFRRYLQKQGRYQPAPPTAGDLPDLQADHGHRPRRNGCHRGRCAKRSSAEP